MWVRVGGTGWRRRKDGVESMRTMKGCLQAQLDGAKDVGFETTYKKGGEKRYTK